MKKIINFLLNLFWTHLELCIFFILQFCCMFALHDIEWRLRFAWLPAQIYWLTQKITENWQEIILVFILLLYTSQFRFEILSLWTIRSIKHLMLVDRTYNFHCELNLNDWIQNFHWIKKNLFQQWFPCSKTRKIANKKKKKMTERSQNKFIAYFMNSNNCHSAFPLFNSNANFADDLSMELIRFYLP